MLLGQKGDVSAKTAFKKDLVWCQIKSRHWIRSNSFWKLWNYSFNQIICPSLMRTIKLIEIKKSKLSLPTFMTQRSLPWDAKLVSPKKTVFTWKSSPLFFEQLSALSAVAAPGHMCLRRKARWGQSPLTAKTAWKKWIIAFDIFTFQMKEKWQFDAFQPEHNFYIVGSRGVVVLILNVLGSVGVQWG